MWVDAVDLRDFYATGLGLVAKRMITRRVRRIWPDVKGQNVLGLGYAVPFLNGFRSEAARVTAAMPASQGVLPWPAKGKSLTTLVDQTDLPFDDLSIDRVLLAHALECDEQVHLMMREIWRVMASSGRLLVVTPNRRGIWTHLERTPFGHGRPYSAGQLCASLRDSLFTPGLTCTALFAPPLRSHMALSSAGAWEKAGERWFARFGGVVMIEATKQVYAGQAVTAEPRRSAPYTQPGPNPASTRLFSEQENRLFTQKIGRKDTA